MIALAVVLAIVGFRARTALLILFCLSARRRRVRSRKP